MRQIARAQNMDITGDSPYNPINGAESSPKIALLKAARNQLASSGGLSPFVPMTRSYMPQKTQSYAKPALVELGAGRPLRSNHALKDLESPSARAQRNYPHQIVTTDKINLSDIKAGRGSTVAMTNLIKSSQDNLMQLGGPALKSSHAHSQSTFVQTNNNQRSSSIPG